MGWARADCRDEELLERMSDQIKIKHQIGTFFEAGNESEVANVLSGMSQLGYRNEEVIEILFECLVGKDFEQTGELFE